MTDFFGLEIKNCKPMTANNLYRINRKQKSKYKPDETKEYIKRVRLETRKHKDKIFDFETSFSIYEHALACNILVFVPYKMLITQKGYISNNSIDIDNVCKILIDAIFKEFDKLDDKMIVNLIVNKVESEDENFNIMFGLQRINMSIILKQ